MAVVILTAGALLGVLLGRIFNVAVLAPVSLAVAGVIFASGLSETQSALATVCLALAVPVILQLGYLVGLASLPVPVPARRKRTPH